MPVIHAAQRITMQISLFVYRAFSIVHNMPSIVHKPDSIVHKLRSIMDARNSHCATYQRENFSIRI